MHTKIPTLKKRCVCVCGGGGGAGTKGFTLSLGCGGGGQKVSGPRLSHVVALPGDRSLTISLVFTYSLCMQQ